MIGFLRRKLRARRSARLERLAKGYGQLSDEERAEQERFREVHDPLAEFARGSVPPGLDRFEDDSKRG